MQGSHNTIDLYHCEQACPMLSIAYPQSVLYPPALAYKGSMMLPLPMRAGSAVMLSRMLRTYGHIAADDGGRHVALRVVPRHMHGHAVLDVCVVPHLDVVHIPCTGRACAFGQGELYASVHGGSMDKGGIAYPLHRTQPALKGFAVCWCAQATGWTRGEGLLKAGRAGTPTSEHRPVPNG